jgi:Flp pilus assembly protein TadG
MTQSRLRKRLARMDGHERGQTLVEFALVFPLFILLLMSVIEFAFAFNANLAIAYASRDAALTAAEAGNSTGGDCAIVKKVVDDVGAPADANKITTIEIYWSDSNGAYFGGNSANHNVWVYGTPTTCTYPDGTSVTVPFNLPLANIGYAEATRCNVVAGCPGHNTTVDTIGVRVNYTYAWKTPLHYFGNLFGNTGGWNFSRSNAMRMEPVL